MYPPGKSWDFEVYISLIYTVHFNLEFRELKSCEFSSVNVCGKSLIKQCSCTDKAKSFPILLCILERRLWDQNIILWDYSALIKHRGFLTEVEDCKFLKDLLARQKGQLEIPASMI